MELANKLFKGDRVIWIIFMFLCLISVVEMFSATSTLTFGKTNFWAPIIRHASFLLAGFALILVLHNIPCQFFSLIVALLPISALLLLLTHFIGSTKNEAVRELALGGLSFQPLELGKLSCIVFTAFLLSKRNMFSSDQIFKYILIGVGVICALIFTENLSTCIMLFGICYLLMFIGQVPFKRMAQLTGVLLILLALFIVTILTIPESAVRDTKFDRILTWKSRITNFAEPKPELNADTYKITKDNYQVTHAQIAIARGGVFGKLPGHGKQRDILPQAYADYIYAIIIEELGIVGGFFVLLLYVMIMIRVGMIARKCDKLFPKLLVLGCGLLIVIQAFANMAVAVNFFPVTGQPLPLISRGGTSIIVTCVCFGIILSVSRFGAGINNEEEEDEEENDVIEIETDIIEDNSLIAVESIGNTRT